MRGDGITPMLNGEKNLIDIHFQIKTEGDWYEGDLDKANKVKEAKDQLAKAIENYFDALYLVRYSKNSPENSSVYDSYHYPILIKEHEEFGNNFLR